MFGLLVLGTSYTCLTLALANSFNPSPGNPLNVPVGVTLDVKIAQFFAILIGLLMEEEIPESLYLLRMINEGSLHQKEPNMRYGKFILCALLRIVSGYLFLLNIFIVVVQSDTVIDIFFDAMALQFLQQIDDIAFHLAKMDVFGKDLKRASTRKCFRTEFERLPFARRKKMTVFVKVMYIINLAIMMTGIIAITIRQKRGAFHCDRITVHFGDDIWRNALVFTDTGDIEEWNLVYSYFNGVYAKDEDETHDGRPIYREQNKHNYEPYVEKTGAVIKYCEDELAWVFMHENIRKSGDEKDSDCPWLLRSPDTDSFNLLEVSGDWSIWTGTINTATFQTTCNWCDSDAECNYHGICNEGKCNCTTSEDDGFPLYSGTHCQHPRPCPRIIGNDGSIWSAEMLDAQTPWKGELDAYQPFVLVYHRVLFWHIGGGNITRTPEDQLVIAYSGSRWLGTFEEGGGCKGKEYWTKYTSETHAFWDRAYTMRTRWVSDPTDNSDPIAVDFYRITDRGARYGPLGELTPEQYPPGSGFFECALNTSANYWAFAASAPQTEGKNCSRFAWNNSDRI
ncbi:hypothetical protein ACHAWF_017755 [Thalassiosira exigua]